MYSYKHEHPAVTADCVVFGFDGKALSILLIERGIEPYMGKWALPGGFIAMDETAEDGATRVLKKETSVEDIYLEQFHTFTAVDRDPRTDEETGIRERVMTIAFLAFIRQEDYSIVAGDDEIKAQWFPVDALPELAFDHKEIIEMGLDHLRWKIRYEPLAFHLLNKCFTMSQVQKIYEVVLNIEFDRRNFQKKMLELKYIEKAAKQERIHTVGRQGILYTFNEEIYQQKVREKNVF